MASKLKCLDEIVKDDLAKRNINRQYAVVIQLRVRIGYNEAGDTGNGAWNMRLEHITEYRINTATNQFEMRAEFEGKKYL